MSGIGDLLETVRLIIQSEPQRLVDFAERWGRVAAAAQGQQPVVKRAITDVEFDTEGHTAQQMNRYRLQMDDSLGALAGATLEVADALREAAPRLAGIRKNLIAAAIGAGLTAVAAGVPVVGQVLGGLVAGGEIVTIVNLVNDYNTAMTALDGDFVLAETKMDAVAALSAAGGLVPAAPELTPTGG